LSARRTLIIIVALAVGTVAAIVTVLYVNSAQSRANHNASLVAVYKVTKEITKSETGDQAIAAGAITRSSIPRQFYPSTAVTSLSEIRGKVAAADLAPEQILVNNQFLTPTAASTTFSSTYIKPGMVAISISLSGVSAVNNFIEPGDLIDLMWTYTPEDAKGTPIPPVDGNKTVHFFYQNVQVIAVGTTPEAAPGSTTAVTTATATGGADLYTLLVPPEAAERITLASTVATIYAALVPPNNQAATIPAVQEQNIDTKTPTLAGPPALTPYGQ
jgi:pilus assembly protein CpaB